MLGVFLLPAFARLGHEFQDLWSPYNASVHRLDLGLYSQSLGEMKPETILTPSKSPLPEAERAFDDAVSRRTASPTHYRLRYSGPQDREVIPGSPAVQLLLFVACRLLSTPATC